MTALETERLILRTWSPADAGDLYEYAKSPNVGPNAGWKPHETREESEAVIRMFMEQGGVWAIECKENHKVIGSIGLHEDRKREGIDSKMVGYVLSEDYWGRGLMSEAVRRVIRYAFDELGLDILSVYHYPHNHRSRRVIEKCGFKYEGILRKASKIYDDTVMDYVCYSMTRDEYDSWAGGNPWTEIDLEDYEKHMGFGGVLQLQALNSIMSEQLNGIRGSVVVLGAAGGNGLEHIDASAIDKVYAVDINREYLEVCKARYSYLGSVLETVQCDLSAGRPALPASILMICNLIIEYLGVKRFAEVVRDNFDRIGILSCVIQKNHGNAFVSVSETAKKLKSLDTLHRDIDEGELVGAMARVGLRVILRRTYPLPNAKEFIRIDFGKI